METVTIKELREAKRQLERELAEKLSRFQEIFNVEIEHVGWRQYKVRRLGVPETIFVDPEFTLDIKL